MMTDLYKLLCMQRPVYLQYEMNAPKSALKCPEQSPSTLTVRPPWRVSRSASSNLLQKPPDQASLCVARTRKGNMAKSGIAVGLNKGHVLTVRDKKIKPSNLKGRCGKRTRLIREVVRDVAGLAPYERRVTELLKVGKDKRALKLCKRKLGTHLRAKKKREEMGNLIRKAKK